MKLTIAKSAGYCFGVKRAVNMVYQEAEEAKVPVIDLFAYSCGLYKQIGKEKIHWITSIKKGCNKGIWPDDFNSESSVHTVSAAENMKQ